MTLTAADRVAIGDLINRHGHLVDAGRLDEAGDLFTPDVVYDVTDLGFGTLHGTTALREASLALGQANPVAHHVTNLVITENPDGTAWVSTKGLGVRADGTVGSVGYQDTVVRHGTGWRISRREVRARRVPLGGDVEGPRLLLERWRQASVAQSVAAIRELYAVDAVHEFPFTRPELPARLVGREAIVDWIAAGWRDGALRYHGYRSLAVHDTRDPDTLVVEQEVTGTGVATGEFTLPNLLVFTVGDGEIRRIRDYVDVPAALTALGHPH